MASPQHLDLHRLIAERCTVHDYRAGDLPPGALERALEAAVCAPNHRMTEPWRFLRVGLQTRATLLEVATHIKSKGGAAPLGEAALQKLEQKMLTPAELLVISQVLHEDPKTAREDYAAVACAVQNAMLALHAEGIGSKWSTGALTTDPRTYEHLGVDAEQQSIVGFLWIGYSARERAPKARRRRSLADVLSHVP